MTKRINSCKDAMLANIQTAAKLCRYMTPGSQRGYCIKVVTAARWDLKLKRYETAALHLNDAIVVLSRSTLEE